MGSRSQRIPEHFLFPEEKAIITLITHTTMTELSFLPPSQSSVSCKPAVVITYEELKVLRTCDFNGKTSRGMADTDTGTVEASQP